MLFIGLIACVNGIRVWCLLCKFEVALHRSFTVVSAMRAFTVIVMLPFCQQFFQVISWEVYGSVKLGFVCLLRTFNFAIKMRWGWLIWTKLDAVFFQFLLHLNGKKLSSPVCLQALYRERHFFNNTIDKIQCVCSRATRVESQDSVASAVINRCVLIQTGANFTGIHLNPITGNRAFVANKICFTPEFNDRFNLILAKNFVDRCHCQRDCKKSF